ncbi:MAG: acylneuraminate cytidylyltransferase family protein [Candidatus Omnitrophota bacterium]
MENNEILTIIPARGGSKGLLHKNIKLLRGKPLIAWTIEAAGKSKYTGRIVVSTDDQKIAEVCHEYEVEVPFLRPKELAKDDTSTVDVVIHLLDKLNRDEGYSPDYFVLLQPTCPLRTYYDIDAAFETLVNSNENANAVVSLKEAEDRPYWMRTLNEHGFVDCFIESEHNAKRRQDLPVTYVLNGAVYLCRTDIFLKERTFLPKGTLGYVMPRFRSVDIDDLLDFKIAELILSEEKEQDMDFKHDGN